MTKADEESQLLSGEDGDEITLTSFPQSQKPPDRSYGIITMRYAAMVAIVIGLVCASVSFIVSSTVTKDSPMTMEEKEGVSTKLFNGNIADPHEQGDDDYTADFYPYNHQFSETPTLFFSGTKKHETPYRGYEYHIQFFENAGYTFTDMYNYLPRINEISIGKFSSIDNRTGEILLTEGTDCDEDGFTGIKRSGRVRVVYGEVVALQNVLEPSPCVYELTVSSPGASGIGAPSA